MKTLKIIAIIGFTSLLFFTIYETRTNNNDLNMYYGSKMQKYMDSALYYQKLVKKAAEQYTYTNDVKYLYEAFNLDQKRDYFVEQFYIYQDSLNKK